MLVYCELNVYREAIKRKVILATGFERNEVQLMTSVSLIDTDFLVVIITGLWWGRAEINVFATFKIILKSSYLISAEQVQLACKIF